VKLSKPSVQPAPHQVVGLFRVRPNKPCQTVIQTLSWFQSGLKPENQANRLPSSRAANHGWRLRHGETGTRKCASRPTGSSAATTPRCHDDDGKSTLSSSDTGHGQPAMASASATGTRKGGIKACQKLRWFDHRTSTRPQRSAARPLPPPSSAPAGLWQRRQASVAGTVSRPRAVVLARGVAVAVVGAAP
jgi:hypothetical protein